MTIKEQDSGQTTEQNILEAAERLFLEKGFALTSTTDIAREVGCNQALIHYYFRTKDKLFTAVFASKAALFFSGLLESFREDSSFSENVRKLVEAHFDVLLENPRLPFLIFNEINTNPGRVLDLKFILGEKIFHFQSMLNHQLQEEIRKGNIRQIKLPELLISIVSLNISMFLGRPVIQRILNLSSDEFNAELLKRKKLNVDTILASLRPLE